VAAPTIVEVYPANNAQGIVLSDTIHIIFDQEIDLTTVSLFIEGPETDRWSGPDIAHWDNPTTTSDDNILDSPGYDGIVPGELSFVKVDTSGDDVSGVYDYTGGGSAWRTKAVFTPSRPLAPNVEYKVYIVGDEESNDEILSGVSSRTVFDGLKGSNLGDGEVEFTGGYTGAVDDKYVVEIKGTGAAGSVEFNWYKESAPLEVRVLQSSKTSILLADGVYARFSGDFEVGDEFSVVVKPAERMQDTFIWTFTTGSGSIRAVPSETASSAAPLLGGGGEAEEALRIVEIIPEEQATNLDPNSVQVITVKFNKVLDEDTISDATVLIWTEPVNGDFETNEIDFAGTLAKVLSVSGDTLTIQIS
jgi:hypothetical protein